MGNKRLISKKAKKHREGKCRFCGVDDYNLLDVHRIIEGKDGGKYHDRNTVVVCALCHRKVHCGQIKIDRYYLSTSGKWLLHFWINGEEKWE